MAKQLSKWDYIKSAFKEKLNIGALFIIVLGFFFGGNLSIPFLIVGGGIEFLYLLIVPGLNGYKQLVKRRIQQKEYEKKKQESKKLLSRLSTDQKLRYKRLQRMKNKLQNAEDEIGEDNFSLISDDLMKLDYLLHSFLELSSIAQKYKRHLRRTNLMDLKKDKENLVKKLESDTSVQQSARAKKMIKRNISIVDKRIDRLKKIKSNLQAIDAQIETIEDTFGLLHDQILMFGSHEEVSSDIENLVSNVETTEEAVKEANSAFDEFNLLESHEKLKKNKKSKK